MSRAHPTCTRPPAVWCPAPTRPASSVADLAHDGDFNSWELTVRRYRARGRPEHIETVVTGTPEPDSEYLEAYLRGSGYGTIGPWVEVGGYGDTGILVAHP